ncbi:MAG: hypothetical protein ACJAUP_002762 [Cellvibrionaceae bacterium]
MPLLDLVAVTIPVLGLVIGKLFLGMFFVPARFVLEMLRRVYKVIYLMWQTDNKKAVALRNIKMSG